MIALIGSRRNHHQALIHIDPACACGSPLIAAATGQQHQLHVRAEGVTGELRGLPDNARLVQGQHDVPGFLLRQVLVDLAGRVVAAFELALVHGPGVHVAQDSNGRPSRLDTAVRPSVLALRSFALHACRLHQSAYLLSGELLGELPTDHRIDVGLERHFVLRRAVELAGIHVLLHELLGD
jgi:hypothetical protein